jgi:hypothetical protein
MLFALMQYVRSYLTENTSRLYYKYHSGRDIVLNVSRYSKKSTC